MKHVQTKPFEGQQPGTSGLRKKVQVVLQKNYMENFTQCTLNIVEPKAQGSCLVLGGDGRFFNLKAALVILRMMAANGVARVITAPNFLISTPCVSAIIRKYKANGGILLTASHNPGGPSGDFGIKYNVSNGGPAPEAVTKKIYEGTKSIQEYLICEHEPKVDFSKLGTHKFEDMTIEIVDATEIYVDLMKSLYDFALIRSFLAKTGFRLKIDAMCGVAGPFVRRIIVKELGCPEDFIRNCDPKEDFGGHHPDPNLVYADELVDIMAIGKASSGDDSKVPDFGAALDGDADRNMILGRKFFVSPSDSVAVIAANATLIPFFKAGLKGVARSMPTSRALDRVAEKLHLKCFEVPTGWKFFGNLMDADLISICGEESFGTGSTHIREKDGLWAILAWLAILAAKNSQRGPNSPVIGVEDIVRAHWAEFGRNYYSRYDYEEVDEKSANDMINSLRELVSKPLALSALGSEPSLAKLVQNQITVQGDDFTYVDPVDKSVSQKQGIRFLLSDGSRVIFRLSGTGSSGATVRVYFERYISDKDKLDWSTADAVAPLVEFALKVTNLKQVLNREFPTVIT